MYDNFNTNVFHGVFPCLSPSSICISLLLKNTHTAQALGCSTGNCPGCLGLVHWDDPEGWYRQGEGRRVQDGNMCIPGADSCLYMAKPIQYCKVKK